MEMFSRSNKVSFTALAAYLFSVCTGFAATIPVQFSGILTQVPVDEVFGDLNAGDSFTGQYTFDSAAPDLLPADPTTGVYFFSSPFSLTVSIDNHLFVADGSLTIGILNGFVDQYTLLATNADNSLTVELFLQDPTGSAFSSDSLPGGFPDLTKFPQRDFHLDALFDAGEVQADGVLAGPPPR